jgi:trimethylamine---corrinoid protein Co-methyltransferase
MTPAEIELLHDASLRILEDIGVRLEHDAVAERVLRAGARTGGGAASVVRLPRKMVMEHLAMAPHSVDLARRDGTIDKLTPDSASAFWTCPVMYIRDGSTRREVTCADLARVARLCDRLDSVQGVMGMALSDVPPRHRDVVGARVIAENTRKHVRPLCFTPEGMRALAEMKKVFPGNWLSIGFTAHGPLRWTNLALSIFEASAGHGIPATVNGEPMAGVTGPVSLAGALAVGNAEILSGIVVNQVLEPGRPVIFNLGLAHVFDMKTCQAVTGGPENALFARASAELGRFYNIPSSSWASTESVFEDGQASMEMTFAIHAHMQSRVSLIWGLGQLESEKTISLARLVMDDEIVSFCRRHERSFEVTPETLQYDLIKQAGIGGSFLDTEHTLANYRSHLWEPKISNRRKLDHCKQTLEETAKERAEEIIKSDTEEKIGETERKELRRIEEAFRKKMG